MINLEINKIHLGNCIDLLQQLAPKSVHTCVSSPPYYALRDYGLEPTAFPAVEYTIFGFKVKIKAMKCCLGLEPTPQDFIGHLVYIYRLVREGLRDDGTCWINIGDSYSATAKTRTSEQACRKSNLKGSIDGQIACKNQPNKIFKGVKPKDLLGIPWMLAFALREDGWFLRQDLIWAKPNPMPESVTDRCTKSHEYIFLLSKSKKYYYDYHSIMQEVALSTPARLRQDLNNLKGSERVPFKNNGNMKASWNGSTFHSGKTGEAMETRGGLRNSGNKERKSGSERGCPENTGSNVCSSVPWEGLKANKRSVWTVTTNNFKEAHFATFPDDLIKDCIKAGCPPGGVVLDMFMGSGTTAIVATKLGRNFIGMEQNPKYLKIAERRMHKELGLFLPGVDTLKDEIAC